VNFPKDDLRLHKSNFAAIGKQLQPLLDSGDSYRMILKPWREKRSLPQNNLSHLWYEEISAYLVKSGRTDATKEWVKRNCIFRPKPTIDRSERNTHINLL
jgi:hypothetical protein